MAGGFALGVKYSHIGGMAKLAKADIPSEPLPVVVLGMRVIVFVFEPRSRLLEQLRWLLDSSRNRGDFCVN